MRNFIKSLTLFVLVIGFSLSNTGYSQDNESVQSRNRPVLWRDPGDITSRDLTYGPGSAEMAPVGPFTFIEEDKNGASPKFRVKDARDVIWTVKLGVEAQPETVATRIVWALGYFAEESYYLDRAEIENLPRLSRGAEHVQGKTIRGARFEPKRSDVTQGPNWDWRKNPFVGQRELDGLKVLMVLLANYDTSPANNRIVTAKNPETGEFEDRYMVTDIGATLGRVGGLGGKRTKNDLEEYSASRFIVQVEDGMVEFDYRTRPEALGLFARVFNPWYGKSQANKEKAMRRIPVESVRWIGTLLSGLTDDQLRTAFQAAGYDSTATEGFVAAIRARIDQLTTLKPTDRAP